MYRPTHADIRWAQNAIALLRDGGMLLMPGCGAVYRVDKQQRQLVRLVRGDEPLDETYFQSREVFRAIGYSVVDKSPPIQQQEN